MLTNSIESGIILYSYLSVIKHIGSSEEVACSLRARNSVLVWAEDTGCNCSMSSAYPDNNTRQQRTYGGNRGPQQGGGPRGGGGGYRQGGMHDGYDMSHGGKGGHPQGSFASCAPVRICLKIAFHIFAGNLS